MPDIFEIYGACFPRHRAAASLKRVRDGRRAQGGGRFPRHRAAASLKRGVDHRPRGRGRRFSAASGRGLIEAHRPPRISGGQPACFPRHRAAASLKLLPVGCSPPRFVRFPRHRAAASLKRSTSRGRWQRRLAFSAASGRGLIEASQQNGPYFSGRSWFSAASGRGLIEASPRYPVWPRRLDVFRGIGPRPH